ncbi:hypothetical protein [Streptomyces sp. NBC_01565]|uniref:hypothetical protein n=1 Tax=unclassified Streptomyces TaxID=2593676 RepID=UPI00225C22A5|nr:hypothetical protein [Streptomyces sp. NBC_01565]MCX4545827.1 hypothetical protein [Streptomyces sp. NBC_01565]
MFEQSAADAVEHRLHREVHQLLLAGEAVLALLAFAAALALRRTGRLDEARRYADPVVKDGLRAAARRLEARTGGASRSRGRDGGR